MYSFDLTDEQRMLTETVQRFASRNMRAVYREADDNGAIPDDVISTGWDLGLIPSAIPDQYGGFGALSAVTGALFAEELGWGDVATSLHLLTPSLVTTPLLLCGTDEQKATYLPRFCEATFCPATAALIEPRIQFDPNDLKTTATRDGDTYVLNGVKAFVPLADQADLMLVYAAEDGKTQAFLVDAPIAGLTIGAREKTMGLSALALYRVTLKDVRVPATNRLGGEHGCKFGNLLNHTHVAMSALAVGQARAAYDYAREYAKEREAFGEPIASRQAIAFILANMAIEIDATRLMTWEAAWKLDQGQDATRDAYLARMQADQMVLNVTDGAVQVLGGHGYVKEHPVEMWLRNGRGFGTLTGLAMV